MEKEILEEIFEKISRDPSLFSTIDIPELLTRTTSLGYLENKNTEFIHNEIVNVMGEYGWPKELSTKLMGYRLIDEIHEIHKGKYIRWIRKNGEGILTNGGIVVNIKFHDKGVYILCLNNKKKVIQFLFDDCIIFQKMTTEEQLILMVKDYLPMNSL
jgi:hypothetical protein